MQLCNTLHIFKDFLRTVLQSKIPWRHLKIFLKLENQHGSNTCALKLLFQTMMHFWHFYSIGKSLFFVFLFWRESLIRFMRESEYLFAYFY
jgi:hypothetical protein